jgi:hypothetical protein
LGDGWATRIYATQKNESGRIAAGRRGSSALVVDDGFIMLMCSASFMWPILWSDQRPAELLHNGQLQPG